MDGVDWIGVGVDGGTGVNGGDRVHADIGGSPSWAILNPRARLIRDACPAHTVIHPISLENNKIR